MNKSYQYEVLSEAVSEKEELCDLRGKILEDKEFMM